MTTRTKVFGVSGHSDVLIGAPGGSDFYYNADGVFNPGSHSRIAGDPGHPGPNTTFSTAGKASSHDLFEGIAGVHNVLHMGLRDGKHHFSHSLRGQRVGGDSSRFGVDRTPGF